MAQINIQVQGKKVEPAQLKKDIEHMIGELGEDGLSHLVQAYRDSSSIRSLVKGEIQARKAMQPVKKAARGFMDKIRKK